MANYMSQVANILGVELGERFKINTCEAGLEPYFYFTDNDLVCEDILSLYLSDID